MAYPVGGVKESASKPKLTVYDYYPTAKTDSTQQSKVIYSFIVMLIAINREQGILDLAKHNVRIF